MESCSGVLWISRSSEPNVSLQILFLILVFKNFKIPFFLCHSPQNHPLDIMCTPDYEQREAFIRKNAQTIVPFVRWLIQTVVSLDNDDAHSAESKVSRSSKSPSSASSPQQQQDQDGDNIVLFALNCLMYISSGATVDGFCQPLCDQVLAPAHVSLNH